MASGVSKDVPTLRKSASLAAFALLAFLFLAPAGARATVIGPNPCPTQPSYSWYGDSVAVSQEIPSTTVEGLTFPSTVLRPADVEAFPGKRPVIVIQHGRNGNRCSLWWVAQFMAGHGYVAEIHAAPADSNQTIAFTNAVDATRAAFAFIKSDANPAAAFSDTTRMGLTGHSLGSAVTSYLQGDPSLGIDAVIASDNLRRYLQGDRGGSNDECDQPPNVEVTPLVPALGFAKDEPCNSAKDVTDPDIKQFGWSWWRSKGMPSVELVMRGFKHGDFSSGGSEAKKHDLSHWYEAWFDHWLLGEPVDRILAPEVNGRPTTEILSAHYLSAACLSGVADTADLSSWLASGSPALQQQGACDEVSEPPVRPAAPRLGSLRVSGPMRVRKGRFAVLTFRLRNSGNAPATNVFAWVKSNNRRVRAPRKVRVGTIRAGTTRTVRFRVRAGNRARGKARIRVTVRNLQAGRTLGIR